MPAPGSLVYALWSFLSVGVILVALVVTRRRALAAMVLALASGVILVPAVVQAVSVERSGYIWQGRYVLVAYATLVALATAIAAAGTWGIRMPDRLMRRLIAWVAGLVILGQTWALFGTLQRYQGAIPIDQVILHPTWTPPGGIFLWLAVVAAGTAVAAFAVITATGERDEVDADATSDQDATREPEASVAS